VGEWGKESKPGGGVKKKKVRHKRGRNRGKRTDLVEWKKKKKKKLLMGEGGKQRCP